MSENIKCRVIPKNNNCGEIIGGGLSSTAAYETFTACLPFGAALTYDGFGFKYTPPQNVTGTGEVVVNQGCIAQLVYGEIPVYTPPPCTPAVSPCDGTTDEVILAPGTDNLLSYDASGRLQGLLYVEAGDNITITGRGSQQNVLRISSTIPPNDTFVVTSTPEVLGVTGTGEQGNPYDITHGRVASRPPVGTGLIVDEYGHVTSYNPPDTLGVLSVTGVPGVVDVTTESGAVLVTLPVQSGLQPIPPKISAGGKLYTVDVYGRITKVEDDPVIEATGGIFSYIFTGNRTEMSFQVESAQTSRFRITYTGDLGTGTGEGLTAPPTGMSVTLDFQEVDFYTNIIGGRIVGLELLSTNSFPVGTHVIQITLPAAVDTPGILDVVPCQ